MGKQKKKQDTKQKFQKPELAYSLPISKSFKKIMPFILLLLPAGLCWYYINYAYTINGSNSFPLDDPWIHLNFARNLAEFGSFSYFKNEVVTAGSTSPLYTFILAAGFFITKNEMILSYSLGIIFLMASVYFYYRLADNLFAKENWVALGAVLLFILDKWLNLIAVSGMETTMYVLILISCFYFYRKRNAAGFAVTLGLVLWSRPDGVAFIGALAVDYIFLLYFKKKNPSANNDNNLFTKKELIKIAVITGIFTIAYFVMNLKLAGTIWPNTYNAKLTYYAPEFRSRGDFLKNEVWGYFTEGAYLLLVIPFFAGVIKVITDTARSKYNMYIMPAVFIFALIFIYWYKLPYAHRFGRYLMPVIPFYILLFSYGARLLFGYFYKFIGDKKITNVLSGALLLAAVVWSAFDYNSHKIDYQDQSHHISIRQVAAAKWIKENTPEGTIIAAHDVGALAYYSGRKIIDVAGLINPELITHLMDKDYNKIMSEEMKKQNVGYTAFLKEWYQVVNQNPLFVGGDNGFEVIEIYKFTPDKTHILGLDVNSAILYFRELLTNRQYQQALSIMQKVVAADPLSSYSYFLLGSVQLILGDKEGCERSLKKALEIFPEYREANIALAGVYNKQNKKEEAVKLMEGFLKTSPNDSLASVFLRTLKDTVNMKPVK